MSILYNNILEDGHNMIKPPILYDEGYMLYSNLRFFIAYESFKGLFIKLCSYK